MILSRYDVGRFAIGPSRFPGTPIVVKITDEMRRGSLTGDCVWGIFKGKRVTLDTDWKGAEWIRPEGVDTVNLSNVTPKCGLIRNGEWVVLTGDEATQAIAKSEQS